MKIKKTYKYSSFAIFLLLCLTLFTLAHINDAKSKYKSNAGGDSNASVAEWVVALDTVTEGNSFNLVTGNTNVDYTIKVKSTSQVSCNYTIIVSNVPNDINVCLDDVNEKTSSANRVIFSNVGSFIIGDGTQEREHKLSFSAPLESSANNNQINIQVVFTQIN